MRYAWKLNRAMPELGDESDSDDQESQLQSWRGAPQSHWHEETIEMSNDALPVRSKGEALSQIVDAEVLVLPGAGRVL